MLMASISIPCLLFLSLLSLSILLAKCDVDDSNTTTIVEDAYLLAEITVYRAISNLTTKVTAGAECLADGIADTFKNTTCTINTTLPKFSDYPSLLHTCGLDTTNAAAGGEIIPVCPQPIRLNNFTSISTYLNSTNVCAIGIATQGNWTVVVLTNMTHGIRNTNGASGLAAMTTAVFSLIICCFIMVF